MNRKFTLNEIKARIDDESDGVKVEDFKDVDIRILGRGKFVMQLK